MSKSEDKSDKTFWQVIPGIIAAFAALITAIGGCIAVVFGIPAISNAVFGVTPTPIISQTAFSPVVNISALTQAPPTQTPYPTYTPFPTAVPPTVAPPIPTVVPPTALPTDAPLIPTVVPPTAPPTVVPPSKVYILESGLLSLTNPVGGNGGQEFEPRKCQFMAVAKGIAGRSGVYVDQIKLLCQQLNQDGRTSDSSETFVAGGDGGEPFNAVECPQNYFIVGITGRAGLIIDYIGSIKCSDVSGHSTEVNVGAGGGGGGYFEAICPQGYAVTGFGGRSGQNIDRLFLVCTLIKQQ